MRRALATIVGFCVLVPTLWAEPKAQYVWLAPAAPFTCNAMQEGAIYQNTTDHLYYYCNASAWTSMGGSFTGTQNTVAKFTSSSTIGNSTITDDGTTVTVNTASTFKAADPTSLTSGFFNVTGTLADNATSTTAVSLDITSAATSGNPVQTAIRGILNAGYTTTGRSVVALFNNNAAGTGTLYLSQQRGNYGLYAATSVSTSGINIGIMGETGRTSGVGSSVGNFGVLGTSSGFGSAGYMIGIAGFGFNNGAGPQIGGWFALTGIELTAPSTSAALRVDNAAVAAPIIDARDNQVKVWSIEDNGSQWAANTKTLTESSATAFARLTIASGSSGGANIDYCIEANDSTDFQSRCGMLPVAAVNKAGAITCTVGTVAASTEVVAVSAGTLTNTFTCADSGTNFLDIKANATSSLTQTTLRINYFVRQQGNAAVAFTPQ